MPFSLSMYLYRLYQDKALAVFEQNNKILSPKDIDDLLNHKDSSNAVRVLYSAVVDHHEVNGLAYHLKAPVEPAFYHDNFKRCAIASGLGSMAGDLDEQSEYLALEMLELISNDGAAGYVSIFVCDALGRWVREKPALFGRFSSFIETMFQGNPAQNIAALVYLDHVRELYPAKMRKILEQAGSQVRFVAQKALFNYYVSASGFMDLSLKDSTAVKFMGRYRFISNEKAFEEGARVIGLIPGVQRSGFLEGTQQYSIGQEVKRICGLYVAVLGKFNRFMWG